MEKDKTLGQLELEVLKMVWNNPGSSVSQLTDELLETKQYARTTILTVVQRLHKKGFLRREKKDGSFRYTSTDTQEYVIGSLTERFIEKTFNGSPTSLVQHLTQNKLSSEELAEIRQIIDQAMDEEQKV